MSSLALSLMLYVYQHLSMSFNVFYVSECHKIVLIANYLKLHLQLVPPENNITHYTT